MFHHAHAFLATKLYNSEDNLLVLGSILPDIAITKIISWEEGLHKIENAKKFLKYIKTKDSSYINLANGIMAHNIIDNFSHLKFKRKPGYSFQNTQELVKMVNDYYGLKGQEAKVRAHNYIENAVDIYVLRAYPNTQDLIRKAVKKTDQKALSSLLADFFQVDQDKFLKALKDFNNLFTKYDFRKEENWTLFWEDLERFFPSSKTSTLQKKKLLKKSLQLTKNTYQDFLKYTSKTPVN